MDNAKPKQAAALRSALDIAMERSSGTVDSIGRLSEEQKRALSEVERNLQIKIAEIEIMAAQAISRARANQDWEQVEKLEEQKNNEIAQWRERAKADSERIRRGQ